jgi:hypothetical protein
MRPVSIRPPGRHPNNRRLLRLSVTCSKVFGEAQNDSPSPGASYRASEYRRKRHSRTTSRRPIHHAIKPVHHHASTQPSKTECPFCFGEVNPKATVCRHYRREIAFVRMADDSIKMFKAEDAFYAQEEQDRLRIERGLA